MQYLACDPGWLLPRYQWCSPVQSGAVRCSPQCRWRPTCFLSSVFPPRESSGSSCIYNDFGFWIVNSLQPPWYPCQLLSLLSHARPMKSGTCTKGDTTFAAHFSRVALQRFTSCRFLFWSLLCEATAVINRVHHASSILVLRLPSGSWVPNFMLKDVKCIYIYTHNCMHISNAMNESSLRHCINDTLTIFRSAWLHMPSGWFRPSGKRDCRPTPHNGKSGIFEWRQLDKRKNSRLCQTLHRPLRKLELGGRCMCPPQCHFSRDTMGSTINIWLGLSRDVAIGQNLPRTLEGLNEDVKFQNGSHGQSEATLLTMKAAQPCPWRNQREARTWSPSALHPAQICVWNQFCGRSKKS